MQDRFKFKVKFEIDGQVEIFDVIDISFEYQQVFFRRQDNMVYNIGLGVKGVELIQCTGLRDKNGKLIFEGDILKENWHIYKLEWGNGAYTIKDIKRGTSYMFTSGMYIEKSEVIGNIYENPELLNDNLKRAENLIINPESKILDSIKRAKIKTDIGKAIEELIDNE